MNYLHSDDNVLSSQATKLLVDKKVKQSKEALLHESSMMNTTITHYCPIEAGKRIDDYEVGKPVFLSGHVYKQVNCQTTDSCGNKVSWISSTSNDSTDCISSVKINGSWKEYVGIITSINNKNNTITFGSHGDMLFKVDDASIYQIGDVVLYYGRY